MWSESLKTHGLPIEMYGWMMFTEVFNEEGIEPKGPCLSIPLSTAKELTDEQLLELREWFIKNASAIEREHTPSFMRGGDSERGDAKFKYVKRKPQKGYVYLAAADNGTYKIGLSKEPLRRIEKLGVTLPYALEVAHLFPTDDMYTSENILHERFSDKRLDGEWFELDADDVELIKSIENGADLDD